MRKTAKMLRNGHFFLFIYLIFELIYCKAFGHKKVFRDKMQKSNNIVINKIFSTLACRVLI